MWSLLWLRFVQFSVQQLSVAGCALRPFEKTVNSSPLFSHLAAICSVVATVPFCYVLGAKLPVPELLCVSQANSALGATFCSFCC